MNVKLCCKTKKEEEESSSDLTNMFILDLKLELSSDSLKKIL